MWLSSWHQLPGTQTQTRGHPFPFILTTWSLSVTKNNESFRESCFDTAIQYLLLAPMLH